MHAPPRGTLRYSLVAGIILVVVFVFGYSYWHDYRRARQVNRELLDAQREAVALQTRQVELQDLLKYFDSESYAESRARLELGLVRPGEEVIVVQPASARPATPPGAGAAKAQNCRAPAPISAWWSFFFRRPAAGSS